MLQSPAAHLLPFRFQMAFSDQPLISPFTVSTFMLTGEENSIIHQLWDNFLMYRKILTSSTRHGKIH